MHPIVARPVLSALYAEAASLHVVRWAAGQELPREPAPPAPMAEQLVCFGAVDDLTYRAVAVHTAQSAAVHAAQSASGSGYAADGAVCVPAAASSLVRRGTRVGMFVPNAGCVAHGLPACTEATNVPLFASSIAPREADARLFMPAASHAGPPPTYLYAAYVPLLAPSAAPRGKGAEPFVPTTSHASLAPLLSTMQAAASEGGGGLLVVQQVPGGQCNSATVIPLAIGRGGNVRAEGRVALCRMLLWEGCSMREGPSGAH